MLQLVELERNFLVREQYLPTALEQLCLFLAAPFRLEDFENLVCQKRKYREAVVSKIMELLEIMLARLLWMEYQE